ncbi:hypothetical protein CCR95_06240 [Thiocystis minor]|uniref:hypothetical protein n=1 Tax=Thiocystis minor TaxID=61597 RepID=UPI00191372B1|nr:hypothetical protein [Thiocystis minor]MBK5963693.1 hypothetical protein [Thiocystis minor]
MKPDGVLLGVAVANGRDEFLMDYQWRPPGGLITVWSLTADLARLYASQRQAMRAVRRFWRADYCLVEVYDRGHQLWVGWLR